MTTTRKATTLDDVAMRLAERPPVVGDDGVNLAAAVALVLREVKEEAEGEGDLEALFIRRAVHPDDPWSGDIALPGGRLDPEDLDARAAAVRETLEEVDLDLIHARPLGQIDDVLGYAESIRVSCFVYGIEGDPVLVPNYEISQIFWSPLSHAEDTTRQAMREYSYADQTGSYPTIRLLDDDRAPVLWGITYKFMDDFMSRLGRPIPFMHWTDG